MSFAGFLRQNTAVDVLVGPFVDSTDGDTEETGLTIAQADVRLSKNGQTGAQKNDNTTCAHDADGFYNCELDATDTNTVGQLTLWVHVAGALAVRHDYQVIEDAVYDRLFADSAAGYSTHSAADVWAVATRLLTAGTNIVLAKGTGVTGFTDIDAGGIRTAVGLASANLDTQLADLPTVAEFEARTLVAANYFDPAADEVLANVRKINSVTIIGDGSATPWGPA